MTMLVACVGFLMMAIGGGLFLVPAKFREVLPGLFTWERLIGLSAFRLLVGVIFLLAAPRTRLPYVIYAIGTLSVLSAIAAPALGLERVKKLAMGLLSRPDVFLRGWATAGFLVGLLIAWAALA